MKNIAILLSGTGSNFLAIKDALDSGMLQNCRIGAVISNNETSVGLQRAKDYGLPTHCINPKGFDTRELFDKEIMDILENSNTDLVCLAGYMLLLSPVFVRRYKGKILNIHPSLLPSFKGLKAQEQALNHGVRFSGCTVHFVDEGLDSGPIVLQSVVPVLQDDTKDTLQQRILVEEHKIYPQAVKLFIEGKLEILGTKVVIKD